MDLQTERRLNQRAYRQLKKRIDRDYLAGRYVAIVRGALVADAPSFRQLLDQLDSIERDPDRRLVVQAGAEYPKQAIDL